jgi:hypothetical protein
MALNPRACHSAVASTLTFPVPGPHLVLKHHLAFIFLYMPRNDEL